MTLIYTTQEYRYSTQVPGQNVFLTTRNLCQTLGGQVAWFASVAEMQFLNSLAITNGVTVYWLGLNRVGNVWTWANGAPVTFTNRRPSQPDRCCGSNVTCAIANFGNQFTGMWDDAECERVWVTRKDTSAKHKIT
uniref:C-type lectin domain-containing protein n=1 Tax=Ascaris lumbricoides TaxID=6252 RepID=A0A0M3INK2_ASCLU